MQLAVLDGQQRQGGNPQQFGDGIARGLAKADEVLEGFHGMFVIPHLLVGIGQIPGRS